MANFNIHSQNSPERIECLSWGSQCPGRDLNEGPTNYKSEQEAEDTEENTGTLNLYIDKSAASLVCKSAAIESFKLRS